MFCSTWRPFCRAASNPRPAVGDGRNVDTLVLSSSNFVVGLKPIYSDNLKPGMGEDMNGMMKWYDETSMAGIGKHVYSAQRLSQ